MTAQSGTLGVEKLHVVSKVKDRSFVLKITAQGFSSFHLLDGNDIDLNYCVIY